MTQAVPLPYEIDRFSQFLFQIYLQSCKGVETRLGKLHNQVNVALFTGPTSGRRDSSMGVGNGYDDDVRLVEPSRFRGQSEMNGLLDSFGGHLAWGVGVVPEMGDRLFA